MTGAILRKPMETRWIDMPYKVGDMLEGKEILTGKTREFMVIRKNSKTVDIKSLVTGDIHRLRPDENGILWIMNGKDKRFKIYKAVA